MTNTSPIYHILKTGSSADRVELLHQLPSNVMKSSAEGLVSTDNPMTNLLAFGSLLPAYCHGADCRTAASLGLAVYQYGKECYLTGDYPDLFLMTIIDYAHSYLTALVNLGKFNEAHAFIVEEIGFWELYHAHPEKLHSKERDKFINSLRSVMVLNIDILVHLNHIDEAWSLAFDTPWIEGNWSSDVELQRLRAKLKAMKADVGMLDKNDADRRQDAQDAQASSTKTMMDALKEMMKGFGMDDSLLDKLKQSSHLNPYTKEGFNQLEKVLKQGESYLQKGSGELNEISVRQLIRRASGIFVDNQPSKEVISSSLEELDLALVQAMQLHNNTLINDAYYGLYLCYSRLGNSSKAADQLISLRKNLESVRRSIGNPLERGGVFQIYPYLFYASAEHLFKSERYADMLDAIEGSKGRAITDVLEEESGMQTEEYDLYHVKDQLQPFLKKENAHYLSFHVDDDWSYVMIVTREGQLDAAQVNIGKPQLEKWFKLNLNDPTHQFGKIDIQEELQPFVALLQKHYRQGSLRKNDHLCYAADHLLYLFPIHFLELDGKALIEQFTVSRVHNAGHLMHLLSKPAARPKSLLKVEIPSVDDVKHKTILQHFAESATMLEPLFNKKQHLRHNEANMQAIFDGCQVNQLIHFATHGTFPRSSNPFDNSGLLVADRHRPPQLHLADPDYPYKNEGNHLLSPKRLIQGLKEDQLQHAHVSLQACVAGYAREGIGGDALGLEWAFFQKGTSSLISTFWNIDIQNANEFYHYFYDAWLNQGMSKARAHQNAVLKLMAKQRNTHLPDEYFWAGYGLIGDWR